MGQEVFADIILPLALPKAFTYSIPAHLQKKAKIGTRVVVEFRTNKLYTGIICRVHEEKPLEYKTKPIENILDDLPVSNEIQLGFWKWMADYYLCTIGEVMNAALPSGLKLSSETKIVLNEENKVSKDISKDEQAICEALEKKHFLTIEEVTGISGKKNARHMVKSLLEKGVVLLQEELKEKFKPKMVSCVRFTPFASDEKNLEEIFKALEEKKQNQLEMVIALVKLSGNSKNRKEVKKSALLEATGAKESVLSALVKKDIIEVYQKETGRFGEESASALSKTLSEAQKAVLKKIKKEWEDKEVTLLHGITSSGKTEVYVKLIEEALAEGKQALYLLPEIALTTQVTSRIKRYFGDQLGVYHSRFNENERVEIWNGVSSPKSGGSKFRVILGARSAMFLPFSNLGLVIIDEEHDGSYKQRDPAPRYHARDAAIVLAAKHGAKVLLGSATPSVESYFNAQSGKYGFAELHTRHGGAVLPEITTADVKDATKRKQMKSHFSPLLFDHIKNALSEKEQVIIFQNRRGFAPFLECKACGWVPQCRNCDVSLVYHKTGNILRCHYCGYHVPPPSVCNKCGDVNIQMKNFGTEKVEEELELLFPEARIARMDLDSTRSKFAYQHLINDFEERKIDILVGTQMVTKGLDFDNVSVVGILSADQMINFPDFRAHERSFQVMSQVAGRAGRKNKKGKVIVQTYAPENPVLKNVIGHDYSKMYAEELEHRKNFAYPPYYRLIELTVMHRDSDTAGVAADEIAEKLKEMLGNRVLGPEFALIPRVKNLYCKKILLKISREESSATVKEKIFQLISRIQNTDAYKSVRVQADVDPV